MQPEKQIGNQRPTKAIRLTTPSLIKTPTTCALTCALIPSVILHTYEHLRSDLSKIGRSRICLTCLPLVLFRRKLKGLHKKEDLFRIQTYTCNDWDGRHACNIDIDYLSCLCILVYILPSFRILVVYLLVIFILSIFYSLHQRLKHVMCILRNTHSDYISKHITFTKFLVLQE